MTYLVLDFVFLAAATALVLALHRRLRAVPVLAAGGALLALTGVFDNLMIAAGLFGYAPEALSGGRLFQVPIEDFAYPLAAAILVPALWHRLAPDATRGPAQDHPARPHPSAAAKPARNHAEGTSR